MFNKNQPGWNHNHAAAVWKKSFDTTMIPAFKMKQINRLMMSPVRSTQSNTPKKNTAINQTQRIGLKQKRRCTNNTTIIPVRTLHESRKLLELYTQQSSLSEIQLNLSDNLLNCKSQSSSDATKTILREHTLMYQLLLHNNQVA